MTTTQFRDLSLIPLTATETLVIACDSSAGIGEKQADVVAIDPAITAAYSLRVPLLELLCFGATPVAITDTIGNELHPTGERIISGIRGEMQRAGLADLPLNGSTEDNMATLTTSIGVTVVARIETAKLPVVGRHELAVFQMGTPYVADQVVAHLDSIFSYDAVRQLVQRDDVVDLLPVGSKGVANETAQMAQTHGLNVEATVDLTDEAFTQSAGPATVLLVGVRADQASQFQAAYPDLIRVATLRR